MMGCMDDIGRNMEIAPIKTQKDYRRVLKEIEGLMRAKRNTPEGDRLDLLVTLVEAWERKRYQGCGVPPCQSPPIASAVRRSK